MTVTPQQWFNIIGGLVGAATSTFAAMAAAHIVSPDIAAIGTIGFGFITASLGVVGTTLFGQGQLVQQVSNITGVGVVVDKSASPAMAKLALDPNVPNVDVKPADKEAVTQNAKG